MVKTALIEQSFFGILQRPITFLILLAKNSLFYESLLNIGCDSRHTINNLILVLVFGKNTKKNFFSRHPVLILNYFFYTKKPVG